MRRIIPVMALLLCLAATASALDYGEPRSAGKKGSFEFSVYPFVQYFIWEEFQGGNKLLKESGWQFGGGATAAYYSNDVFYRLRGELFAGHPDYDGQELFTGTPVKTDVVYYGGKAEADMGVTFAYPRFAVVPFWGLGYKAWQRDIGNSGNVFGGTEWWDNFYAILGLRGELGPSAPDSFKGFVELSLKPHILNKDTADFPGLPKINVEPGHGYTAGAEVGAKYGRVRASAYYEYTHWPQSDISTATAFSPVDNSVVSFIQPETKQQLIGVKVGVTF